MARRSSDGGESESDFSEKYTDIEMAKEYAVDNAADLDEPLLYRADSSRSYFEPYSHLKMATKANSTMRSLAHAGLATLGHYFERLRDAFNGNHRDQHDLHTHDGSEQEERLLGIDTSPRIHSPLSTKARGRSSAHLDGLRGLAAFIVFVNHYLDRFPTPSGAGTGYHNLGFYQNGDPNYTYLCTLPFIRLFFSGGAGSVSVFFVLSGYVLSIGPLAKIRRSDTSKEAKIVIRKELAGAVLRRPFRLYLPPVVMSLVVAVLWHVPGPLVQDSSPTSTLSEQLSHWWHAVVLECLPWNNGLVRNYIPPSWTMYRELRGSLWTYLIAIIATFVLTGNRPRAAAFAVVLGATSVYALQTTDKWATPAFVFGMVLAITDTWSLDSFFKSAKLPRRTHVVVTHILLVAGLYLLSQPTLGYEWSLNTPGWHTLTEMTPEKFKNASSGHYVRYWAVWGALMLVYATLRIQWMRNFFTRRSLQYLGKISFMLYLVHWPWILIFLNRLHEALGGIGSPNDHPERVMWYQDLLRIPDVGPFGLNTRFLACMVVAVPTTLGLAHVLTKWLDEPSIAFAEKVARLMGLGKERKEESGLPMTRL